MWTWLCSLIPTYLHWAGQYMESDSLGHHITSWQLIVMLAVMIGFGGMAGKARREGKSFWTSVREGLTGAFLGAVGGMFGGFVVIWMLPLVVGIVSVVALLITVYAATIYLPRMAKRFIPFYRWRRKPKDHLEQLDRSAQEVAKRLKELVAQHAAVRAHAEEQSVRTSKARMIRNDAVPKSAAWQIADELVTKFNESHRATRAQVEKLATIIEQIQRGQREMDNLISLACLCRQAKEKGIAEDARAIQAARAALEALRKAFEQADAVLSAALTEVPDMDIDLAFQQSDEGARRSFEISDSVERIGAPPRVRA
jgi:hypothetical protein